MSSEIIKSHTERERVCLAFFVNTAWEWDQMKAGAGRRTCRVSESWQARRRRDSGTVINTVSAAAYIFHTEIYFLLFTPINLIYENSVCYYDERRIYLLGVCVRVRVCDDKP